MTMTTEQLQLHTFIQRLKQPTNIPPSTELVQERIQELKGLLQLTASSSNGDRILTDETTPPISTPSTSLSSFCHSPSSPSHFTFFLSWLLRPDLLRTVLSTWSITRLTEDLFIWLAPPFPATDVLLALIQAVKAIGPIPSSGLSGGHSILISCLQRFLEVDARVSDLLQECGEYEMERRKTKASTATVTTTSIQLSPHTQSIADQLCTAPDLIANTMQTQTPYSLSHPGWYQSVMTQLVRLIQTHAATSSAAVPSTSLPIYFAPVSAVLTKLTRLGQQESLVQTLMPPILAHIQQLRSSKNASLSLSTSSICTSPALTSPLLSISSIVIQNIGVQALESFITAMLQWIGLQLRAIGPISFDQPLEKEALELQTSLFSILPSIFPLAYFTTSSFFSQLMTRRFFVNKATILNAASLKALVEYIAFISHARLEQLSLSERISQKISHHTLLDTVLNEIVQVWAGGESSSSGGSALSTSTATDIQVYLAKSILFLLQQLEQSEEGYDPNAPQAPSKPKTKKTKSDSKEPDADDTTFTTLGSFANSPSVPYLLSGVHTRLSSPLPPVRRSAMQIARVFSRMMGGKENEIDFEGEELEGQVMIRKQDDAIDEDEDEKKQTTSVVLNPANMINPEHLGRSSSSITPLTPQSSLVDDERDLRKVPLPSFLRDVLDLLHKHADSFDHMEAALEALPKLIRKFPADLPLLAGQLVSALMNAGSNVFLETHKKLAQWRLQSLVELATAMRGQDIRVLQETVAYLITQFYSSNYSLGTKMEILDILRMASEKLADMDGGGENDSTEVKASTKPFIQEVSPGTKLTPINTPAYASSSSSSSSSAQAVSATLAHHQAIIRERVEKRTKRWGATKQQGGSSSTAVSTSQPKTYSVNRFTPVCHLFFYPLMKQIDQPSALILLQQHDSLLLIRLIHTLSGFLPCSSGRSQVLPLATRRMAKVFMEYLLMHSSRIQPHSSSHGISGTASSTGSSTSEIGVRRMIFFGLSRIFVTYNEHLFVDDFPHELPELCSWLTDSAANDTDHECRQLAQANLYFLKQLLGNPFEQLFKQEANEANVTTSIKQAQLPALKF